MINKLDNPRLTAYALGEMEKSEHAAFEAELQKHPEYQSEIDAIRRMADQVKWELANESCPSLTHQQQQRWGDMPVRQNSRQWWVGLMTGDWFGWKLWVTAGLVMCTLLIAAVLRNTSPSESAAASGKQSLRQPAHAMVASSNNGKESVTSLPPTKSTKERPTTGVSGLDKNLLASEWPSTSAVNRVPAQPHRGTPPAPEIITAGSVGKLIPNDALPTDVLINARPPYVALAFALPAPTLKGTPEDLPAGPHIEPPSDRPRAPFLAPAGVTNVALGRKVTTSATIITGDVPQITDGLKEAFDDHSLEMRKGLQWVQIDLGASYAIYAVLIWHDHRYLAAFRDVVVQLSDDPEFKDHVQTIFNNDYDNSAGFGVGTDKEYFETRQGKLMNAQGIKARYVRCYSRGSNASALNVYQEVEVYGLPAGALPAAGDNTSTNILPLHPALPSQGHFR